MNFNLYHIDVISKKSGTPVETLERWITDGIFMPEGRANDSTAIFSEQSLGQIEEINSLLSLGYGIEEIRKIIKKVGLPEVAGKPVKKLSDKNKYLTVGSLAEKTGVSPRTLKHWEEKGIIEADLRSAGGFRLYRDHYILFCHLIRDLQLFGYSLDEIKTVSDYFRDFVDMKNGIDHRPPEDVDVRLEMMNEEIRKLFSKTEQLKSGIKRWEDLLKKQKKQLAAIAEKNRKRIKKDNENEY